MMNGLLLCCLVLATAGFASEGDPATMVEHGHYKQARVLLEKRLAANAKDVDVLVLLARVNLAYSNSGAAIKLLEQATALQPKSADAHVYLADAYSRSANDAGMFEKMRLSKIIRNETEQALSIDPKNIDALEGMMEFYLEAPGIMGGSRSKADETAERIMALDPVRGNLARAANASHEKEYAKAEGFYIKAVQANSKSYEALASLGSFYLRDGAQNYDKAADYAQQALQADPRRSGAYAILAQANAARERWADLDQLLAKAEKELPDDFLPDYMAGRTLLTSGKDNARAERYFRKYLTQPEEEGGTPPLASAHWRLAQVLEKEGRKQDAIQELQTAVQMKPDFKEAQKDLKRLQKS